MSRILSLIIVCLLIGGMTGGYAGAETEALGMLYPALSPDASQLAFSYQGDIWTVPAEGGKAWRLTVSTAYERNPVWSPNGRWIAFSSNRDGNYDVFVIPAKGGEARQITFHSAGDYVTDWSPDGDWLLFTSSRHFPGPFLLEVNVDTGAERRVLWDQTSLQDARYSPDGKKVAIVRGPSGWTRFGYRGSGAAEIWTCDTDGTNFMPLDDYDRSQFWPSWSSDGKNVYFISDRGGRRSLWVKSSDGGGAPREVMKITGKDLLFADVANDGKAVVWADGRFYAGRVSPAGLLSEPKPIPLQAGSDTKLQFVTRNVFGTASEMTVSPDGKWLATVVHGDIFVQPIEWKPQQRMDAPRGGEAVNFTNTPFREHQVRWHPDSDKIVFLSDKSGYQRVYVMDLNKKEWTELSHTREIEINPQVSPDGKKVAFFRGVHDLIVYHLEEKREKKIADGYFRHGVWAKDLVWSPDSQWLAYTDYTKNWATDIFVVKADGSESPRNITQYPTWNGSPLWSPDGKFLFFLSNRRDRTSVYLLELKPIEKKFEDVFVFGKEGEKKDEDEKEKEINDNDNENGDEENLGENAENVEETKKDEEKEVPKVEIDFEDIHLRARPISMALTDVSGLAVSPNSEMVIYQAPTTAENWSLWISKITGEWNQTAIGTPFGHIEWNKKAGLYGLTWTGGIQKINVSKDRVTGTSGVGLTARMTIDRQAELLQMYDEAWRNLSGSFYDPRLHGRDMDTAYKKYRRMVEQSATNEEFGTFTSLLLGELNASHLGVYPDDSFSGIGADTASLGVLYDWQVDEEGLRIAKVLERGPADKKESRLYPGDVILEIEGTKVGLNERTWKLLDDRKDKTTRLTVKRAKDGCVEEVKMMPISSQSTLEYEQWVEDNREKVHELSNNRVAYTHIRGMSGFYGERFERELFSYAQDYDGIIIDVRYNGGGWLHEFLFELLGRKPFGYSQMREWPKLAQPEKMFLGPKVVITHESSFSDAEIFPYGFRALGLGKLVGRPTFGGVIGTGNYSLIDGTVFRLPINGWFRLNGSNMENEGEKPDVDVALMPGELTEGRDRQLEVAVEEVLKQLK